MTVADLDMDQEVVGQVLDNDEERTKKRQQELELKEKDLMKTLMLGNEKFQFGNLEVSDEDDTDVKVVICLEGEKYLVIMYYKYPKIDLDIKTSRPSGLSL